MLDNAMFACSVIIALISVPFIFLSVPAGIQVLAGDWTAWNGLIDQGWHSLGFFAAALCCLILIVGAALE